jgi:hypothetical protein
MNDEQNSKMILGDYSATTLPNIKGRFLFNDGGIENTELQGYYFTPDYIERGKDYRLGRMLTEEGQKEINI